ncbi:hypothetical protein TNCV_1557381 [Trichonephila clavipes]|nr:hypothetical protein TNCV_1557381 [Trichonephila clavipes]
MQVICRTLDAIHNAANQDLHLVAHLLGPVRKTTTCVGGKAEINEKPPVYTATKLVKNFVSVAVNGHVVNALVDSGADYSVVSEQLRT